MSSAALDPRWRGHAAPWLLIASFALNVAALFLPFMDLRQGLSTQPYTLFTTIEFLWDSKLYVLAAVVVAFSVVFPFAKLGLLASILVARGTRERGHALLELVERCGKWSMLDVFLVALMITLANDQLLVAAAPRAGIVCFSLAIAASLLCSGSMLARLHGRSELAPLRVASRWLAVAQVALLALLVAAWFVPFLEIDDWLLSDRPVSIAGAIADLWDAEAKSLAFVMLVALVLAPLASGCLALGALLGKPDAESTTALRRALGWTRHWEMLDVFAVALGIFLVEGRSFVRTELSWGAFLIALLLALYWPASSLYYRRLAP